MAIHLVDKLPHIAHIGDCVQLLCDESLWWYGSEGWFFVGYTSEFRIEA